MATTTLTRHETTALFLAALAGPHGTRELIELRYRLVGLIRTRQGSRVLLNPLLDSNDDGIAASLAIAFRRKRAWLQLVARRLLLVSMKEGGLSTAG